MTIWITKNGLKCTKKLVYWDLEIDQTDDQSMSEGLSMQHVEANTNFAKFIDDNYEDWLNEYQDEAPLLSHKLMEEKVFPKMGGNLFSS